MKNIKIKFKGKIIGFFIGLIFSGNIIAALLLAILAHFLFDTNFLRDKDNIEKEILECETVNSNIDILKNILELCLSMCDIKNKVLISEIEVIKKIFKIYFKFDKEDLKELNDIIKSIILNINEVDIKNSISNINNYCRYEEKLNIIHLLFAVASSDMPISDKELIYIFNISQKINIISSDYNVLKEHFLRNEIDYYEILGISKDATISDIKKAYRKAILEHHPDKRRDNNYDNKRFQEIVKAYNELIKSKKHEKR